MKKLILISVYLFFFLTFKLHAHSIGNIYLNQNMSATLVFDEPIQFIVFGNNPILSQTADGTPIFKYYEMFQSDNTLIIRLADLQAPFTNLTIKLQNGVILHGMLIVDNAKALSFYDFRTKSKAVLIPESNKPTGFDLVRFRVAQIIEMPVEYTWLGNRRSGMEFQVANMRNDQDHKYIKIIIRNNSGAKFNIDGAIFRFEESKGRGLSRRGNQLTERVIPVHHSEIEYVAAYSSVIMGYALPLFAVGDNGRLVIQILEKGGSRHAKIVIPASDLLKVSIFPDQL